MNRNLTIHDLLDELLRLVYSICYSCEKNRLSIKSCCFNILISRNYDTITICDLFISKNIFCSA